MNADGSGKLHLGEGESPSWSPDGKQILHEGGAGDGFGIMNADGSGRRLVRLPFYPNYATWAPNGKIVFMRVRQPSGGLGDSGPDPYAGGDLYAVNPDGSGLRRLTKGASVILPSVSPDGSTIAAYATKRDRLMAIPYRADGSAVTLLARASRYFPNGALPLAHWASDGKQLVLGSSSYEAYGGAGLFLVNADGSGLTWIPDVANALSPDWRPQ
jgi:TolB protein